MAKEFLRVPYSYKPAGPIETPYLRARQEWDERMGMTLAHARNWRRAFSALAVTTLSLVGLLGFELSRPKLLPFVVTVNEVTGAPVALGALPSEARAPSEREIKYFLISFIRKVRSVPTDPVLIKKSWIEAYQFLGEEAAAKLNALTNNDEDSPLKRIGDVTVTVHPVSVARVGGSGAYQVRWREEVFSSRGAKEKEYVMSGIFSVESRVLSDEESLMVNPLGLFVTDFQWSREL